MCEQGLDNIMRVCVCVGVCVYAARYVNIW